MRVIDNVFLYEAKPKLKQILIDTQNTNNPLIRRASGKYKLLSNDEILRMFIHVFFPLSNRLCFNPALMKVYLIMIALQQERIYRG